MASDDWVASAPQPGDGAQLDPDGLAPKVVVAARNDMSGGADTVLQAGAIVGGVHFHGVPSPGTRLAMGRRISEWDPFDLDVHRAIAASRSSARLPSLPRYVRRDHDDQINAQLGDVSRGLMVVLTGESSTGKTRALYEAVLRHPVLSGWPVVYPRIADDLLRLPANGEPGSGLVLWLDETHTYLAGVTGDAVAAWLRTQLDGSRSGPLVVLGTMWPQYWAELVAQPPPGHRDEHVRARALLQHVVRRIRVAERFSAEQLASLETDRSVDPRVATAAAASGPGRRVIQTLAGGPALVERYEHPDHPDDRYAAAVLTAAIDARRLGYQSPLTPSLLAVAAEGYLGDRDRVDPPADWNARGLARTIGEAPHGITALVPIRTQAGAGPADGYELHDYLEQHGRITRRTQPAPASLWEAVLAHADDPEDQYRLAHSAYRRLLYRYADRLFALWKAAGGHLVRSRLDFVDVLADYGRVDEAVRLLTDIGSLPFSERSRLMVDRLTEHGRTLDAVTLLRGFVSGGVVDSWVGQRLTNLLIDIGEKDEAIGVLRQWADREVGLEPNAPWPDFTNRPWAGERLAELLAQHSRMDELRQLADAGDQHASQRLADLLADQGQWEAALQLLGSGARWTRTWLARRLAAAGQLEMLRRLCGADDSDMGEYLVEALLDHGQIAEALDRLPGLYDKNPRRWPSARLIDLLVKHYRVGQAVDLLILPRALTEPGPSWSHFLNAMVAHGRSAEIVPLLRRLADTVNLSGFRIRRVVNELLADQLAAQGRWEEVLSLLRADEEWPQYWLPQRLAKLGRIDPIRRLADRGNQQARQELVRLLVAQGRGDEAVEFLRGLTHVRDTWASRTLIDLLGERGDIAELRSRTAAGEWYSAHVLIALAQKNTFPDSQQLLTQGLDPDGSLLATPSEAPGSVTLPGDDL